MAAPIKRNKLITPTFSTLGEQMTQGSRQQGGKTAHGLSTQMAQGGQGYNQGSAQGTLRKKMQQGG